MKTKLLTFVLSLAFLAISLAMISAGMTITTNPSSGDLTLTQTQMSGTVTLTLNDLSNVVITNTSNIIVSAVNVTNTTNVVISVNAKSIPLGTSYAHLYINATNASQLNNSATLDYTINLKNTTNPLCSGTNVAELEIASTEFDLISGFGDEDDPFFYPLDKITYTFTVENNGNYDVENIEITACLWDVRQQKCIVKESKMDISDDSFDLDYGDEQDVKITYTIDPNKLKAGNNEYLLYVGAKGKIHDRDAPDSIDDTLSCTSGSDKFEIRTDDNFVILNNIVVPDSINCNSEFQVTGDLWNIGNEDLNNDEVYVRIYNGALGIDERIELTDDLDAMDKQELTFLLKTNSNVVVNKIYNLEFTIYNDDSYADNDVYQNQEDDEAKYSEIMKVTACGSSGKASITADFSANTPNAQIGKQVVLEATVKNTGTSTDTYTVDVTGNSQWSSVASLDPKTITLNAGESKKVLIYLDVNEDTAAGDKELTIKATSSSSSAVSEQKVVVPVQEGFSSSALINHFKNNWYIYVIVLVNLILIIAIIAVIVRLVRKSSD
jgi:hypothetical protein